jgi:two-component system, sporulation sensor kinase E
MTNDDDYIQLEDSRVSEERTTGFNRDPRLDAIEQIAASLAHGIRNPLTVIKGYLQFCQSNPSYCTRESFNLMMQEVECIEELINSLISLARNKAIEKSPQDLNQILIKLFPVIQAEAIQHGITAELCLSDILPVLEANREELRQLIVNLTRNGLEAMSGSGRLTIGTGSEAGKVVLSVQDEGSGISPEQIKKIFDPFYTTKVGNVGLGLAIGLSIVERHQGNIQIASNIGEGTTVRVVFPILEQYKEFLDGK